MSLQPASATPAVTNPTEPAAPLTAHAAASRNGSASLGPSRLPRARRWSRKTRVLVAVAVLVLFGSAATGGFFLFGFGLRSEVYTGPVHIVTQEFLEFTIVARRAPESAASTHL